MAYIAQKGSHVIYGTHKSKIIATITYITQNVLQRWHVYIAQKGWQIWHITQKDCKHGIHSTEMIAYFTYITKGIAKMSCITQKGIANNEG